MATRWKQQVVQRCVDHYGGFGSVVAAAVVCRWIRRASWRSTTMPLIQLARVLVGSAQKWPLLASAVSSSTCTARWRRTARPVGAPWVVTLEAVFFAMVLVDRIFFTPSLAYIEFMASPLINMCSRNSVMRRANSQETGAYSMYFRRLYPQLPKLHVLYGSDAQIHGIPIVDLMHARPAVGHRQVYQAAARELIKRMCNRYGIEGEQQDV